MRKTIAILSVLATSLMSYGASAQPEGAPPAAPAPEGAPPAAAAPEAAPAPAPAPAASDAKKMTLGVDAAFQLPLGDLADATGMGFGGLLRFEYNLMPQLNLTARAGYIFSLKKETDVILFKVKSKADIIPIWVGAKYFLTDMIYGGAELGVNILRTKVEGPNPLGTGTTTVSDSETKLGANVGAGVLVSGVDIRAAFEILNLGDAGKSMGLLVTAGYNFMSL